MSINQPNTKSPCIGVCSTGIGDSVCRGCKRFVHEVVNWNSYSEHEKQAVMQRISALVEQVSEPIIEVYDEAALREGLDYQHVRFDEQAGPYVWILELLKVGANSIDTLESFGCRLRPQFEQLNLEEVREQINKDFYTLSEVHYQRYFQ